MTSDKNISTITLVNEFNKGKFMKMPLARLSNEKAQKELKQFAVAGFTLSLVALILLGWLGVIGLAVSVRALILCKHTGNIDNPKLAQYRTMAIIGAAFGLADTVVVLLAK